MAVTAESTQATFPTSSSRMQPSSSSYSWHTGSGGPATHYTEGKQLTSAEALL